MKRLLLAGAAAVVAAGMLSADHHEAKYESIASVHDLMADIVKPNMDKLGEMRKTGGPQNEKQWKQAHRAAAVLGAEGTVRHIAAEAAAVSFRTSRRFITSWALRGWRREVCACASASSLLQRWPRLCV